MMKHLNECVSDSAFIGKTFSAEGKTYVVKMGDNFSYTDPIDKSFTSNQVMTCTFTQ